MPLHLGILLPFSQLVREFIKLISKIANNINQITMKFNIKGYAVADELDYLRNTINQFSLVFQKKVYAI